MASIISAIEETFQDNNSLLKLTIFTLPTFFAVKFLMENPGTAATTFGILAQIFWFGLSIRCIHNASRGEENFLPDFNIFKTFWIAIKGLVAIIPLICISYGLKYLITTFLFIKTDNDIIPVIFYAILHIVLYSICLTSYILFTHNFRIIEAYNFKLIFKYCMDFLLQLLFFAIKCAILNILVLAPIGYLVRIFFWGTDFLDLIAFLCSFAFTINLTVMSNYFAQLDYEIIETENLDNNTSF